MDVEKLTDSLNAPVQGTGADGLKLAMALLWERRDECLGAVPILVAHDEVVVECEAEQAADAKAWLEKAMIGGMDAVMNSAGKACVPVEVEARIARSGEKEGSPMFRRRVSKRAGGGRGHIEEGRRRLDVLGEQSRRREELQQKRRRMRLLRAVLCAVCDRCGARSAGFGFRGELGERCATTAGAP